MEDHVPLDVCRHMKLLSDDWLAIDMMAFLVLWLIGHEYDVIYHQVVAYILAFLIILCASIASKGTLVFMLKQVAVTLLAQIITIIKIVIVNIIFIKSRSPQSWSSC